MTENDPIFLEDIQKQGSLFLLAYTSSMAKGRIASVSVPQLEKGYGIIRPEDLPGKGELAFTADRLPLFAREEIAYQGQTLLLIYGPQEEEVKKIRDSIKVEYETDFESLLFESPSARQILKEKTVTRGKIQGKEEAAFSKEDTFRIALPFRQGSQPLGAFAWRDKDVLTVYSASRWPFLVRDGLKEILGLEEKQIRFVNIQSSQPEEPLLWYPSFLAIYAALGTHITGKPCRLLIPPEDSLFASFRYAPIEIKILTGLAREGRVQFRKISVDVDAGAQAFFADEVLSRLCLSVLGGYPQGNTEVTARLIKTSNPPLDGFSDLAMAPGFAAMETHVTRVAQMLGLDPGERKLQICLRPGKGHMAGELYTEKSDPAEVLQKTIALSDFGRKYASYRLRNASEIPSPWAISRRRGIGISLAYQGNGFLDSHASAEKYSIQVRLDTSGILTIFTSGVPGNPRSRSLWRQTAAKVLQISPDNVRLETLDSGSVPDTGPALFSRNITVIPRLIEKACVALQKKRFRAPLPLEVNRHFRLPANQSWDQENFQGKPFISLSWGAAAVELELSPVSLMPRFRKVWMTIDCGKILEPAYARAAVEAAVYSALSWCLEYYFPSEGIWPASPPPPAASSLPAASPLQASPALAAAPSSQAPPAPASSLRASLASQGAGTGFYRPQRSWDKIIPMEIHFIENHSAQPGGLGALADNTIPGAFLTALEQALGKELPELPYNSGEYLRKREEGKQE